MTYLNDFDAATYGKLCNDIIKVCMAYDHEGIYLISPKNIIITTSIDNTRDIDVVIIIKDSSSKYDFCKDTSRAIADLINKYNIYISVTPIFSSSFNNLDTMFIKNISLGKNLVLNEENEEN